MATKPEDDELLLQDEVEQEEPEPQNDDEPEGGDDDAPGPDDEGEEEETVISFGGDAPPSDDQETDTGLVKKLRAEIRERDKRLAALSKPAPAKIEVGPKPTLADFEFDEDKYEAALDEWKETKRAAEEQEAEATRAAEEQQQRAAKAMEAYTSQAAEIPDIEDAEAEVGSEIGEDFLKAIKYASGNPALVKALQLYPDKRKALADLRDDPLKAIFEAGKLAAGLTVTKKRKAPAPEEVERGGGAPASSDRKLERLEREAAKPGADRTELIRYKRQLRERGK